MFPHSYGFFCTLFYNFMNSFIIHYLAHVVINSAHTNGATQHDGIVVGLRFFLWQLGF